MSNINTNGINSNYPTPGVNNSTQGFRDNFSSIKNNLNTAYDEITDLQNKVIVKAALNNTTLDNDMGNTLISNAAIRSFRQPTYNLGAAIPSSLTINVSQGDIQYGTITQDTNISFGGWAPTGTKNSVQLYLTVGNSAASIQFPDSVYNASNTVIQGSKPGIYNIQNFSGVFANGDPFGWNPTRNLANSTIHNYVSIPAGVTELQLNISTVDCGSTIDIEPINVSQISDKVRVRSPGSYGTVGDVQGSVAVDAGSAYFCIAPYGTVASLTTTSTTASLGTCIIHFAEQPMAPFKVGGDIVVAGVASDGYDFDPGDPGNPLLQVPTPSEYNGTFSVTACTTTSVSFASPASPSGHEYGAMTAAGTVTGPRVIWGQIPLSPVNR